MCGEPVKHHKNKHCSKACYYKHVYESYIERWLNGDETGGQTLRPDDMVSAVRRWLGEQRGELCWGCGWDKVNSTTGKVPVQVDHIDGDPENHHSSNLRLLCPSCHSLTPTYMALNKGKGRKSRYRKRILGT